NFDFSINLNTIEGNELSLEVKQNDTSKNEKVYSVKGSRSIYGDKGSVNTKISVFENNKNMEKVVKFFNDYYAHAYSFVKFKFPYKIPFLSYPYKLQYDSIKNFQCTDPYEEAFTEFTILDNLYGNCRFRFPRNFKSIIDIKIDQEKFRETAISLVYDHFGKTLSTLNLNLKRFTCIDEVRLNKNVYLTINKDNIILNNLLLEFKIFGDWVPWDYLSDGSKRLFYMFSQVLSNDTMWYILVEEPELGLHPDQVNKIMIFLKEQAKERQVIISTHSPQILNILNEDELNRIIISELTEKGTEFHHLSFEKIKKAKSYMKNNGVALSDYWIYGSMEDRV
ncbi:MAG: ATP-binding protein, partial [Ignavibacteria bacterium]|nr:ATP-binding protein [Ignavibacteria bacterium]